VLEVRRYPVELGPAIDRAVQAVLPTTANRQDDLQVVPPPEPLAVRADPDYLQTILVELLSNATRYTAPGDAIRVTADRAGDATGDAVEVTVADAGPGIAPEFLPHVFQPLLRGDGRWDWEGGHVGIRLAVARRLAETMGGSLGAQSEGPGSSFILTLPAAEVPETASGERGAS
jgi:signal transduction histidine kinase